MYKKSQQNTPPFSEEANLFPKAKAIELVSFFARKIRIDAAGPFNVVAVVAAIGYVTKLTLDIPFQSGDYLTEYPHLWVKYHGYWSEVLADLAQMKPATMCNAWACTEDATIGKFCKTHEPFDAISKKK